MSQQGGTYRKPSNTTATATANSTRPESSSQARGHDGGKTDGQEESTAGTAVATWSESSFEARSQEEKLRTDGQQWEVVNSPVSDNQNSQTDPPSMGLSSHFDFHVGWGKWKFTLFSWDVNVKM
ncbi:hypothetical protein QBC33DRAFT_572713 [Phialemonium atrogriseum]|uniref:Uncharacterized protein n=1 Tax=Phialemonium atrogriseum TaxID=1093897 RepID=A0AAJ0BTQ3_9PEZI|nr:uncharacterized protein QBC33DRAFT_572713 [Phialemonium atrogriseum]KAK1764333.1 hypothetical protein QBC33DRAFT_572713 [Phialemonium atrogriseum]